MVGNIAVRWIGWAEMGYGSEQLQEELEGLNTRARELEATIAPNVAGILEAS